MYQCGRCLMQFLEKYPYARTIEGWHVCGNCVHICHDHWVCRVCGRGQYEGVGMSVRKGEYPICNGCDMLQSKYEKSDKEIKTLVDLLKKAAEHRYDATFWVSVESLLNDYYKDAGYLCGRCRKVFEKPHFAQDINGVCVCQECYDSLDYIICPKCKVLPRECKCPNRGSFFPIIVKTNAHVYVVKRPEDMPRGCEFKILLTHCYQHQ